MTGGRGWVKSTARRWALSIALVTGTAALLGGGAALLRPSPAEAHCDSVNGPVVAASRQALDRGDVRLVLPYVKPQAEPELTAAFERAIAARRAGSTAAEVADRWFFETAVRLHRAGEGAPYTGLKQAADIGPALTAAEHALEEGAPDAVATVLNHAVLEGLTARLHAVQEARAHAAEDGSVTAQRARAEAELAFETYVDQLYRAALGEDAHSEDGHAGE